MFSAGSTNGRLQFRYGPRYIPHDASQPPTRQWHSCYFAPSSTDDNSTELSTIISVPMTKFVCLLVFNVISKYLYFYVTCKYTCIIRFVLFMSITTNFKKSLTDLNETLCTKLTTNLGKIKSYDYISTNIYKQMNYNTTLIPTISRVCVPVTTEDFDLLIETSSFICDPQI